MSTYKALSCAVNPSPNAKTGMNLRSSRRKDADSHEIQSKARCTGDIPSLSGQRAQQIPTAPSCRWGSRLIKVFRQTRGCLALGHNLRDNSAEYCQKRESWSPPASQQGPICDCPMLFCESPTDSSVNSLTVSSERLLLLIIAAVKIFPLDIKKNSDNELPFSYSPLSKTASRFSWLSQPDPRSY